MPHRHTPGGALSVAPSTFGAASIDKSEQQDRTVALSEEDRQEVALMIEQALRATEVHVDAQPGERIAQESGSKGMEQITTTIIQTHSATSK
jgi:hypothetical protein